MSRLTQVQKVVAFLKENGDEKFTSKDIALKITDIYKQDYEEKRSKFESNKDFITQVAAEIGSQKNLINRNNPHVFWRDKPRPRVFWYDDDIEFDNNTDSNIKNHTEDDSELYISDDIESQSEVVVESLIKESYDEYDLYPILIEYLKKELRLYSKRIDEKRSSNSRGFGGNRWLHPDIVAMEPIDKVWDVLIKDCVEVGAGQRVRLWSFEVKKELTNSNVRESFFQAVSNSSWANEGYLVATSISNDRVEQELRMLSALHGIGVILLNPENPSESEMVLPSTSKNNVDWQSVNRIVEENRDFKEFVQLVYNYYKTKDIRIRDWE